MKRRSFIAAVLGVMAAPLAGDSKGSAVLWDVRGPVPLTVQEYEFDWTTDEIIEALQQRRRESEEALIRNLEQRLWGN